MRETQTEPGQKVTRCVKNHGRMRTVKSEIGRKIEEKAKNISKKEQWHHLVQKRISK